MKSSVLVVGAGIGGLATALRLVKSGYRVTLLEKNEQAGGRLNRIAKDGFVFDTGPTFFSMSYEFEQFARECQISLPFRYHELDTLYAVQIRGNPKIYALYKDPKKLAAEFAHAEPDFEKRLRRYLDQKRRLFEDTVDAVIRKNFDSRFSYWLQLMRVNPVHLPMLFRSFWGEVCRHFESQEARQIISLVAFFLGRTPFDTMAVYTLLSYTEFAHDGYYNVEGGMYAIVEGLRAELEKEKVPIFYDTDITGYQGDGRRLALFTDQHGRSWKAEAYVVNADAAVFRGTVFQRPEYSVRRLDRMNWTMGYLTIYLGLRRKVPPVHHHHYFLGSNYESYATRVMRDTGTLEKPYYYVNVVSRHNPGCAPEGCESLFFVCPVPHLLYKPDWSDRDRIVNSILDDFSARIGMDIRPEIISQTVYTPVEWQGKYHLHRGSGLGLAHDFLQIGAYRPSNRDEQFDNVFYVGASTVPGAGLPMAIISSRLTYERVERYFHSDAGQKNNKENGSI